MRRIHRFDLCRHWHFLHNRNAVCRSSGRGFCLQNFANLDVAQRLVLELGGSVASERALFRFDHSRKLDYGFNEFRASFGLERGFRGAGPAEPRLNQAASSKGKGKVSGQGPRNEAGCADN